MKKKISLLLLVTLFATLSFPIIGFAIDENKETIDYSLLDTVAYNPSDKTETRKERHVRLLSEGYELVELNVTPSMARTMYITGPDGKMYETRIATSTYRQPQKVDTKYGNYYLNIITTSTVSRIVDTLLGFIPKVGWVPSALGINTTSLADFLSRGKVTHTMDSTLFFYDIEVKLAGTNRYYFVASSERFEAAITALSSGFTQLGSPVHKTVSANKAAQSSNYGNEQALSRIAVNVFVTGGSNYDYVYFEHYQPFDYMLLN